MPHKLSLKEASHEASKDSPSDGQKRSSIRTRIDRWLPFESDGFATSLRLPFHRSRHRDQMFRSTEMLEKSVSLTTPPPISELPTELLMDIFSYCVEYAGTSLPVHPGDRKGDSKIDLSHVCSRWRDIVLGMRDLWTTFSIREPNPHKSSRKILDRRAASLRDSLQSWIGLSGHLPINLFLDNVSRSNTLGVMPHAHRCKLLSLSVNQATIQNMLALFSETSSHLEEFRFETYDDLSFNTGVASALHDPLRWHSLSRLVWTSPKTSFPLVDVEMPNLMDIDISSHLPVDQCVRFLSGCPNLQTVRLCRLFLSDGPPIPIRHPRIQRLSIECYDSDPCSFFPYFDLPRGVSTRPAYQSLADLVARSSCRLAAFHVTVDREPQDYFAGYVTLPCLQSITTLGIHCRSGLSDATLKRLVWHRCRYLPCLRTLRLNGCATTDGRLAEVITSRFQINAERGSRAQLTSVGLGYTLEHLCPSRHGLPVVSKDKRCWHEWDSGILSWFVSLGLNLHYIN
ncbi:hypothetical protein FPV67DRAFT_1500425 [Lyophyllum atratum]|nr:hypothetical protein FPV67DRAFT_1500425 [Lyophyllum atratum]